jgi:tetratricopeptide (TPR) repeat protein
VRFPSQPRFVICLAFALIGIDSRTAAQSDLRQTAISLEQQGKTAEAASVWEALSQAEPSNPEPFAHLGLLEARQQHYAPAIRFYRKALALAPAMPGLQLNLGLALFKNGDYRQALQSFAPIIESQPNDQRLNILVGMSHYGLGEYAKAAPFLMHASDRDPSNLTLLLTLAHSCLLSSQYPCVLDAYHRLVAQNAESAEADMLVGEALDEMKDPIGAMREFRAAVVANPKEPNVHFGLGYLLWTKGQYPEASKEFQAELDNDPHHLQASLYLADSEMQMGQMENARPLLEKLVEINPENSKGHLDLGIVYAADGSNQKALDELQSAIRLAPNEVNAHYRLARLYKTMGQRTEAAAEFEKARALNKAEDDRLLKVMSKIPVNGQTPPSTDTPSPK